MFYSCHAKHLSSFYMRCLWKLLHIKRLDRIPDKEVLHRRDILSIYAMLNRSKLRWAGHMCHMSNKCLPKRLFYSKPKAG